MWRGGFRGRTETCEKGDRDPTPLTRGDPMGAFPSWAPRCRPRVLDHEGPEPALRRGLQRADHRLWIHASASWPGTRLSADEAGSGSSVRCGPTPQQQGLDQEPQPAGWTPQEPAIPPGPSDLGEARSERSGTERSSSVSKTGPCSALTVHPPHRLELVPRQAPQWNGPKCLGCKSLKTVKSYAPAAARSGSCFNARPAVSYVLPQV